MVNSTIKRPLSAYHGLRTHPGILIDWENKLRLWMIRATVFYVGGSKKRAAALLGVSYTVVYRTLRDADAMVEKEMEKDDELTA